MVAAVLVVVVMLRVLMPLPELAVCRHRIHCSGSRWLAAVAEAAPARPAATPSCSLGGDDDNDDDDNDDDADDDGTSNGDKDCDAPPRCCWCAARCCFRCCSSSCCLRLIKAGCGGLFGVPVARVGVLAAASPAIAAAAADGCGLCDGGGQSGGGDGGTTYQSSLPPKFWASASAKVGLLSVPPASNGCVRACVRGQPRGRRLSAQQQREGKG